MAERMLTYQSGVKQFWGANVHPWFHQCRGRKWTAWRIAPQPSQLPLPKDFTFCVIRPGNGQEALLCQAGRAWRSKLIKTPGSWQAGCFLIRVETHRAPITQPLPFCSYLTTLLPDLSLPLLDKWWLIYGQGEDFTDKDEALAKPTASKFPEKPTSGHLTSHSKPLAGLFCQVLGHQSCGNT